MYMVDKGNTGYSKFRAHIEESPVSTEHQTKDLDIDLDLTGMRRLLPKGRI